MFRKFARKSQRTSVAKDFFELKRYRNGKLISCEIFDPFSLSPAVKGKAETDILPGNVGGRVYYQGTSWPALSCQDEKIHQGEAVLILERRSLTLFVARVSSPNPN